jgi:hypothetical protein
VPPVIADTVRVSAASGSLSLESALPATPPASAGTLEASLTASGGSFAPLMVMTTFAVALPPLPSPTT